MPSCGLRSPRVEIAEFVELKRPKWAALERLLDKAEATGLKTLNLDEARALSRLYRSASSDLLWVRSRAGSADVNGYLNDLVARAYALTYPGKRVRTSEITGICIAGAAGFIIARGMIAPKGLSRRAAVRREAVTAVQLLFGTLALFVLAGCIEGTISQIHPPRLSVAFKIGFALVVGGGVYAYLLSGFLRRAAGDELNEAELKAAARAAVRP